MSHNKLLQKNKKYTQTLKRVKIRFYDLLGNKTVKQQSV